MQTGGRYIAGQRGAFDQQQKKPAAAETSPELSESETLPATAPMFETALAHMGPERSLAFWRWFGDLP